MNFRAATPCERCSRRGRCTVASDGSVAICRSPEAWSEEDLVRRDRGGGEYIVLRGDFDPPPDSDAGPDIAEPEVLNAVYRSLRDEVTEGASPLSAHDAAALSRRGLDDAQCERLGYWSITTGASPRTLRLFTKHGQAIYRVPGIFARQMSQGVFVAGAAGLAIPVRNADGFIIRVRVRYEEPGDDGKPRKVYAWLSSPTGADITGVAASAVAHVPLRDPVMPTDEVWVTEGELKSDIATLKLGRLCISIPGVSMWDRALPALRALGARRAVLAFDSDARTNPGVAGALQRFAGALAEEGIEVAVATWPERYKGIDDVLVALGVEAVTIHDGLEAIAQVRELVASSGAAPSPIDDAEAAVRAAVARAKDVVRAPFEWDILNAAALLRRERPGSWAEIKDIVRAQGAPRIREWEGAIRGAEIKERRARREAEEGPRTKRKRIRVTDDETDVVERVLEIIAANEPELYARTGRLSRVVTERIYGIAFTRIEEIPRDALREIISRHVQFYREKRDKHGEEYEVIEHPPGWCVTAIYSRGTWPGVRTILSVADAPVLTARGEVLDVPGFDEETGCLYAPSRAFARALSQPTREEGAAALARIAEVVGEFLYSDQGPLAPEENRRMHLAAALALPLTLVARPMILGPIPAWLVDGPDSESGKSTLVETLLALGMGSAPGATPWKANEEEWGKGHLAALRAGPRVVYFDNVPTGASFGHATLDAVLTQWPVWQGRILGESTIVAVPNGALIVATGNNPRIPNDTIRRMVRSRLDKPASRPPGGFRYRLPAEASTLALRLVADALTAIRAWIVAGRPKADLKPWGSFDAWADIIPQVLKWYGYPDIRHTQDMLREEDEGADALGAFLRGWAIVGGAEGMSTTEALNLLGRSGLPPDIAGGLDLIREGLEGLDSRRKANEHNSRTLGRVVAKFRGKVVKGMSIASATHIGDGRRWIVRGDVPAVSSPRSQVSQPSQGEDDDGYLN